MAHNRYNIYYGDRLDQLKINLYTKFRKKSNISANFTETSHLRRKYYITQMCVCTNTSVLTIFSLSKSTT